MKPLGCRSLHRPPITTCVCAQPAAFRSRLPLRACASFGRNQEQHSNSSPVGSHDPLHKPHQWGEHHYKRLSSIDHEKEASRRFRRTHFGLEEWAVHRSTGRYWRHIKSGLLQSRIVRGLAAPLVYVGVLSILVCSYESALQAHALPDMGPAWHWPTISVNFQGPFSLSTFALSLLLVFRTNSSYQRWCEARKMWGLLINRSRDIARQVTQWFALSDAHLAAAALRYTAAFPVALMASLRDDVDVRTSLEPLLAPQELQMVLSQPHPGSAVLQALGACVRASSAKEVQKLRIDENITVMQDVMGGCERIFRTPIPLSYTRHTSRFLVCWLTCLPFCVADSMGWLTVIISCAFAFFLFGIEEIGVQIEEPFGILALEIFCATVAKNVKQHGNAAAKMQSAAQAAVEQLAGSQLGAMQEVSQRPMDITVWGAAAAAGGSTGSAMQPANNSSSLHDLSSDGVGSLRAGGSAGGGPGSYPAVLRLPAAATAAGYDGISQAYAEEADEVYAPMAISSAITSDDGEFSGC